MRLLLDTHIFLWFIKDDSRLSARLRAFIEDENIELLPIKEEHLLKVATLPFYHRDPFDRLIISQSFVEKIPLLSVDSVFDAYGVERIG